MKIWHRTACGLAAALMGLPCAVHGQTPSGTGSASLGGSSWQLVRFQGGDGTVVTPDDGSKYTLTFGADGAVAARIDCNRGRGSWKSAGQGQLALGPLALTRAMCPPQSMHDRIVKHWSSIRSYVVKDTHLFLSLMADGGIYEFQPVGPASPSFKSPLTARGPVTFTCGPGDAVRATFYPTQPAMVLLERAGLTRLAFQTKSASGSRYEGDGVLFWEGRGEATVNWAGAQSICKKS